MNRPLWRHPRDFYIRRAIDKQLAASYLGTDSGAKLIMSGSGFDITINKSEEILLNAIDRKYFETENR